MNSLCPYKLFEIAAKEILIVISLLVSESCYGQKGERTLYAKPRIYCWSNWKPILNKMQML